MNREERKRKRMKMKRKSYVMVLVLICLLAMLPIQASAAKKSIKLNKSKVTIYVGQTAQLKATVTGMKNKVKWKSSKPSVATVSSKGVVKAKKAGKTRITAKAGKKSASCVVTVKKTNYKKAYADYLAKHDTFSPPDVLFYDASYSPNDQTFVNEFFLADVNKDKTPELITFTNINFRWQIVKVYSYSSGKVKRMKTFDNNASANGGYYFYICPKKHIHNNYSGGFNSEQTVYKVGSKIKEYLHMSYNDYSVYEARKNGKAASLSRNEFQKLTKNCRSISVRYNYTNTESNRSKLAKGKCKVNK